MRLQYGSVPWGMFWKGCVVYLGAKGEHLQALFWCAGVSARVCVLVFAEVLFRCVSAFCFFCFNKYFWFDIAVHPA